MGTVSKTPYKHQFRHRITFQSSDPKTVENRAVIMAFSGAHTKAIAAQLGISPAMAQYRIIKGLGKGVRKAFRDCTSTEFQMACAVIAPYVMRNHLRKKVAPLFVPPSLPTG